MKQSVQACSISGICGRKMEEMKRYPVCARTCRRVSCKVCGLGEVILKERDYVRSTTGVHAIMIYRDCRDSKRPPFFFLVDSTTIRRLFVDPTS